MSGLRILKETTRRLVVRTSNTTAGTAAAGQTRGVLSTNAKLCSTEVTPTQKPGRRPGSNPGLLEKALLFNGGWSNENLRGGQVETARLYSTDAGGGAGTRSD
jgi:hypothetical protein